MRMDFKDLIYKALEGGQSMEDLMAEIANIANEVEEEISKNDRDVILDIIDEEFWDNVTKENLDIDDAARLLVLILCNDTEAGEELTGEEITEFYEFVKDVYCDMIPTWRASKAMADTMNNLVDKFTSVSNKSKEVVDSATDRVSESFRQLNRFDLPTDSLIGKPMLDSFDTKAIKDFLHTILDDKR